MEETPKVARRENRICIKRKKLEQNREEDCQARASQKRESVNMREQKSEWLDEGVCEYERVRETRAVQKREYVRTRELEKRQLLREESV